jgi:D-sedoheptulose 7-phosphate isomerase
MRYVTVQQNARAVAVDLLARRDAAGTTLAADAAAVAEAGYAMAQRFHSGGKLLVFGNGSASTDAAHLAVEFMHPVIVGKPALPAIALNNDIATVTGVAGRRGFADVYADQLRTLACPADIALAISANGTCPNVYAGVIAARERGLLTVLLTGNAGGEGKLADHLLVAHDSDPAVVKEVHVTIYHLLWELVHLLLAQPAVLLLAKQETAVPA